MNRKTKIEKINDDRTRTQEEKMSYSIKRHLTSLNNQAKVPHPYFGHVYNRSKNRNVNRDGFYDNKDFYKIKSNDPSKFYIGIFGGSVAKGFAIHQSTKEKYGKSGLKKKIREAFPRYFKDKEILILNFGVSAYKQPQQFLVSSFYSKKIDMAITIDGYNEIAYPYWEGFKADFPSYSNLFYSLDPGRNKYIERLYTLVEKRTSWRDLFNANLFQKSLSIGVMWKLYDYYLSIKIENAHNIFKGSVYNKVPYYAPGEKETSIQNASVLASIWGNYSWKQHLILSSDNVIDYFFIQPNQHIKNTKNLNKEELQNYYDSERSSWLNLGYQKLLEESKMLKIKGLNVVDLTKIFIGVRETVYRDACCHLNYIGRNIMENNIFEYIKNDLANRDNFVR